MKKLVLILTIAIGAISWASVNKSQPAETIQPIAAKKFPVFEAILPDGTAYDAKVLKGKVVYVDIWATWCGPCKQEIPFMKKLEEEYKGKNIVFLSISLDSKKFTETWKKFVTANNMAGIQVQATQDGSSLLHTELSVQTIPRFLLVDKNGDIVIENAPRPSSKGVIKEKINQLLN